jgi:hypothetical protein
MIIPLTSADDPRLAPYRGVKERDLLRNAQRFIVEGKVTLTRLVEASRFPVESVFLAENRVGPLTALLLDPPCQSTRRRSVMDGITGFHHRGVLAVAAAAEQTVEDLQRRCRRGR